MNLLERFFSITDEMAPVFKQRRTARRATSLLVANLLCMGRRWVTRLISTRGRDQRDWSADYKLFSRAKWSAQALFTPAIRRVPAYSGDGPIGVAADEVHLPRAGRHVKRSRWLRDPMSPPFHVNLIRGIRFLQFSALLPLHRTHKVDSRAVPVSFEPIDVPEKPAKKASVGKWTEYRRAKKVKNLCAQFVRKLWELRQAFDLAGAVGRMLVAVVDGGFCNRTVFGADLPPLTAILARGRKDAVLCRPVRKRRGSSQVYGKRKFTPEKVRTNTAIPWHRTTVFYGGAQRTVRYKEVHNVLWQGGARRRPLRLIVVAPMPYKLSQASRTYYRQPGYLFCSDHELSAQALLQLYFDRWQIEVNHRDEKQLIGVADPQVWNGNSVDRIPAFLTASYSFLLLASLEAYGPERTDQYIQPPKWQRSRRRPSCLDLLNLARRQAAERPDLYGKTDFRLDPTQAYTKMAA